MSQPVPQAERSTLYVAFELSASTWKLAMGTSESGVRIVSSRAGDTDALAECIARGKAKLGLDEEAPVRSCFEAGRDGFWLHRHLVAVGIDNVVVDSASIEVQRRSRVRKTDRLDATKLLSMLLRHARGERVWSVVRVPTVDEEDARRLHRERERLVKEQTAHKNRIRGLLALHGLRPRAATRAVIESIRLRSGAPLPSQLQAELSREVERLELVTEQLRQVQRDIRQRLAADDKARTLMRLVSVGERGAVVLGGEFFAWRRFDNRRQIAGAAGLAPTPYASGDSARELGISKAGNRRVRHVLVEMAWMWLRYQPQSALSRWYAARFGSNARMRRVGIVALARKLLIALWRFVEHGIVPEGSRLRAA